MTYPTPENRPQRAVHGRPAAAAMARPKDAWLARQPAPALPPCLADLSPAERRAMRAIAEGADLYTVNGRTYIVAAVDPETVDTLAAFEAETVDLEDSHDDEPSLGWTSSEAGYGRYPERGEGITSDECGRSEAQHGGDIEFDIVDCEDGGDDEPDNRNVGHQRVGRRWRPRL